MAASIRILLTSLLIGFVVALNCPDYLNGDTTVPCYGLIGKCYCFSTVFNYTGEGCVETVNQFNMSLVRIETKEEDEALIGFIANTPVLAGFSYMTNGYPSNPLDGSGYWGDMYHPMNYTNWAPGQPSSYIDTGVACNSNTEGQWSVYYHGPHAPPPKLRYICESQ